MAWERRRDDPANRANAERQPRARKDRKRWCRGKPGVKHQPSLVASRDGWLCHLPEAWHRQMWPGEDWVCWHREECTACGRVLRTGVAPECPDRALPPPTGQPTQETP